MTAIRFVRVEGPDEAFDVMAGRRHVGRVVKRCDGWWDAILPGDDLRSWIETSRANALGVLMDYWGI